MQTCYKTFKFLRGRILIAACMMVAAFSCFYQVQQLYFVKTTVYNLSNRAAFEAADLPGFVRQTPNAPKLLDFRRHTASLILPGADEIAKVIAVQHWVRSQEDDDVFYHSKGPIIDGTEDPEEYLQQQRRRISGACRRISYIFTGALLSVGLNARLVTIAATLNRHSPTAHDLVEVWIEKSGKWILVDPTVDAFVLVDGQPASLLEVYDAAQPGSKRNISLDQHGSTYRLVPIEKYRNYFRHVYVARTNAIFDGYRYGILARRRIEFVHFAAQGIEPYPQRKKEFLLLGVMVFSGIAAVIIIQVFAGIFFAHELRGWKTRGDRHLSCGFAKQIRACARPTSYEEISVRQTAVVLRRQPHDQVEDICDRLESGAGAFAVRPTQDRDA